MAKKGAAQSPLFPMYAGPPGQGNFPMLSLDASAALPKVGLPMKPGAAIILQNQGDVGKGGLLALPKQGVGAGAQLPVQPAPLMKPATGPVAPALASPSAFNPPPQLGAGPAPLQPAYSVFVPKPGPVLPSPPSAVPYSQFGIGPAPPFQPANPVLPLPPTVMPYGKFGPSPLSFQPANPVLLPKPSLNLSFPSKLGPPAPMKPGPMVPAQPLLPAFAPMKPGQLYPAPFQPLPQPAAFAPGRVEVFGSLSSDGSVPLPQPLPDPNQCPFCSQRQVQGSTPCGHGYCGTPCMQNYIKLCYDGSHLDQIPCIACRTPLPFPFLVQMFGEENVLRRTLREHVEGILRARVCPGNEDLFNLLTNYKPMPPFNCSICRLTKEFRERWDLTCAHTFCKGCLNTRITQSVAQRSFAQITCPICSGEIPYMDVWCLVSPDTRVAYEQIVPPDIVIDGDTGLISYTCPIHHFFHIVLDSNRPWVKCDICNVRYCTRCPKNTLYQNHVCPNRN